MSTPRGATEPPDYRKEAATLYSLTTTFPLFLAIFSKSLHLKYKHCPAPSDNYCASSPWKPESRHPALEIGEPLLASPEFHHHLALPLPRSPIEARRCEPCFAEENNCCLALLLPYCRNRRPRVKTLPPSLLLWKPHAIVALPERSRTGVSSPYFGVLLPNCVRVEERRGPSPLRCRQVGDQLRKGGPLAAQQPSVT